MYELDVEIWPTCIVVPAGYRVALTVRGRDYEYEGQDRSEAANPYPSRGCGPFTHTDPQDRPAEIFGGKVTVYAGGARCSHLLLPIIPCPG